MKKQQDRKKLVVSVETVRSLERAALGNVAGGIFSDENSCMPLCAPYSVEVCP